ncbi:MAG: tRNA epoxyqueuosine(34) reductase QueG, partial [Actinobacteria bacterium]|nr:tRNA epoxyqueuosine(34) reductase QueG [Actinomycetota bacterium]
MTATAVGTPLRRDAALTERVLAAGRAAGLVAVGATTAEPFVDTRTDLEVRRAAGYASSMQFTYRNPARSTEPGRILEGARSIVAAAWPTDAAPAPDAPTHGGRIARYVWRDHYGALRHALEAMGAVLREAGFEAVVVSDDNALVDRAVAHRAGLGWYGKNANVLVPGHGSWVVLGSVVTNAALVPADAPVADACGSCQRCVDGCPTGAIVAPGVVDARRCLAWLVQAEGTFPLEHRVALGDRIYGCDDCQEVCPPARVVTRREMNGASSSTSEVHEDAQFVDLVDTVRATDDELLAAHGRWYIARRDPRHIRRNALIALGNTADPSDELVVTLLCATAESGDELLAEHAQWALRRIAER